MLPFARDLAGGGGDGCDGRSGVGSDVWQGLDLAGVKTVTALQGLGMHALQIAGDAGHGGGLLLEALQLRMVLIAARSSVGTAHKASRHRATRPWASR